MSSSTNWVELPCPLCGADESDLGYERVHETGSVLGRLRKVDVICRRCGFMYTNPRPSVALMRQYYAEASGASGSIYHSLEPGSRLHTLIDERVRFMEPLIAEYSLEGSGCILDIGCAVGDLLSGLSLPGWRKVGLEPSTSASEVARDRGLEVLDGEIESTPLPANAFDVVACISALEHVWDLSLALETIAKTVKPSGLVFIEVPDSTRPDAQIAEFYSFEHFSHFTLGTLIHALRRAGLELVAVDDAVGIPNLRVCARRTEGVMLSVPNVDNRSELVVALDRYRTEREELETALVERLGEKIARWAEKGARVAIYGAGMHTRFLLSLLDLAPSIACVLDSDPGKAGSDFLDWKVHAPSEIPELKLDAVLISTNAFESEVYAGISSVAQHHGIEVVRCYA